MISGSRRVSSADELRVSNNAHHSLESKFKVHRFNSRGAGAGPWHVEAILVVTD